jgi:glycosyltransferase involved in cell wall biosynthesis
LPDQVIAHVGRIDPKNNLPTLIRAFARFVEASAFGGKLVLVGGEYAKSRDTAYLHVIGELGMGDRIIATGPVPAEELPALYSGALMVAFPSLHEGFGIVAAEAMACGAPLVVSGAGALKEVVGDAALVVESPYDVIGLAEAMQQLWADPASRVELRRKGLARVDRFRPGAIAEQTLQCYRDVAGVV